jgi:IS30 family transposase
MMEAELTPDQLRSAGIRIFGRKKWVPSLANALGIDRGTVYRQLKRDEIEGVYSVAIAGMLEHNKRQRELERAAIRLRPKRLRRDKGKKK